MSSRSQFRSVAMKAGICSIIGVTLNTIFPNVPIAIVINVGCLFYMYREAELLAVEKSVGFEPLVAAETIVAFGVFSLIAGLTSMILSIMLGYAVILDGNYMDFLPFVEGLLTAGLAPLGAMLFRIRASELEADFDASGDLTDLAKATSNLTSQINAASTAMRSLKDGAGSAGIATTGLASSMKSEADKWGLALQEGQAHVKTFGEAARSSSGEVSQLADATSALKKATADVSILLEELSRLISSVERFVEPRTKKS